MGAAASLNEDDSILTYLSTRLIYPVAADDTPPYERIAWWKIIFSYLGIKNREQLELRWMCRIFRDALPCLPLWTSFPHPKYPTLRGLTDRLNHLGNDYVDCEATDISIGLKVYVDRHGDQSGMPGIIYHGTYKDYTITEINPDGTYNTTEQNNVPLAKLKQKVIHILPSLLFIEDGTMGIINSTISPPSRAQQKVRVCLPPSSYKNHKNLITYSTFIIKNLTDNIEHATSMHKTRQIDQVLSAFNEFVQLTRGCNVSDLLDKEITIEELCLYLIKNGWIK
jgi:hypothetical protein